MDFLKFKGKYDKECKCPNIESKMVCLQDEVEPDKTVTTQAEPQHDIIYLIMCTKQKLGSACISAKADQSAPGLFG